MGQVNDDVLKVAKEKTSTRASIQQGGKGKIQIRKDG